MSRAAPPSKRLEPTLVKTWTDAPAEWSPDLRAIVHAAVSIAREDGEVAPLVQLGLERRFGCAGRWAVAAGRGAIVYNTRTLVRTRALLRVPCLARELLAGGELPRPEEKKAA